MFNLIRGNRNNLQGKASLFLEHHVFESDREIIEFPAIYVVHNILDLSFPGESLNPQRLKQKEDELKKIAYNGRYAATRMFRVNEPKILENIPGDIIQIGKTINIYDINPILFSGALIYSNEYNYQISKNKIDLAEELQKDEIKKLDEQGLTKRLYELAHSLMSAKEEKNTKRELEIMAKLHNLSEGQSFERQIDDLVSLMSSNNYRRYEMMDKQIQMAALIHVERYEEAAILRNEINELMNTKQ